ncbi:hypothetical protein D3C76_1177020 [compost metagenome]
MGHSHTVADGAIGVGEDGARDHLDILIGDGPLAGLLLQDAPGPLIERRQLRRHVGQQEALLHGGGAGAHVRRRRLVAPVITRALVVRQGGAELHRHLLVFGEGILARHLTLGAGRRHPIRDPVRDLGVVVVTGGIALPAEQLTGLTRHPQGDVILALEARRQGRESGESKSDSQN